VGIALKNLSESERIRIARELFKVTRQDEHKGELHGCCPVHGEKNASFSYNYRTDTYHCFACGDDGDLCGLWSKVKGYSKEDGFRAFCDHYAIGRGGQGADRAPAPPPKAQDGPKITPEQLEAVWEKFPPLPETRIQDLEDKRRWTRRALEILDLRLQTHYMDPKTGAVKEIKEPDRIAIPVRDAQGRLQNIRLYRPGGGQNKIISWAKTTGSARLFPSAPMEASGPVLVCEGEPDSVTAVSQGFTAITQTSKTKTWPKEHLEPLKGRDVVVCYDADCAGQLYALFAALSLLEVAASVRILRWPDAMGRQADGTLPEDHGQDLTDYFAKHAGTPEGLRELLAKAPIVTKPLQRETVDALIATMGFPAEGKKYSIGKVREDFWTLAVRTGLAGETSREDLPGPLRFFDRGVNDRLSFKPRLLADHIMKESSLMYDPSSGLLYKWNGRIWELYAEEHVSSTCIRLLGNESQKSRVEDACYQIKRLATIPHGRKMNDQADWVCTENGMLNLRTLEFREHDREFLSTFMLPVTWSDSGKKCNRFLSFLEETIQTVGPIMQIQEFAGYCLTTSTSFEKCLLLLGPGADGKSTFLKILRELVGAENTAAVSFPDLEDQFQRSSLYGKLLNISTEVGSKMVDSQYFKAITSGDPLNAAFKHKNSFEFCPYCKLAFAANRLPRSRDNSDGFFRRILPIRFKRQFINDFDPDLFGKLKAELSEIFVWAVEGLQRLWDQKGFTDCEETRRLMLDHRRGNNPVLCYVEDRCVLGEDYEVFKKDLYKDYRAYCEESGFEKFNIENFFRELYSAYNYLRQSRPQIEGERKYMVKGIKINVDGV